MNIRLASCTVNLREPLNARGPVRRRLAKCGPAASKMRPKGGRRRRNLWKASTFHLELLQTLEIPQNRQSFLWKCLEKTSANLEKFGNKLGGPPLFRHNETIESA